MPKPPCECFDNITFLFIGRGEGGSCPIKNNLMNFFEVSNYVLYLVELIVDMLANGSLSYG